MHTSFCLRPESSIKAIIALFLAVSQGTEHFADSNKYLLFLHIIVSIKGKLNEIGTFSRLRESRNWTQKYVASYLCVTQRSYGHYENGTRSLPLEHLIKLTELYDVSSDYILGITDEKSRIPSPRKGSIML